MDSTPSFIHLSQHTCCLQRKNPCLFFYFHVELLNYGLMQKFHNHTIQPETGSYALYSHKNSSKLGAHSNNINQSRSSGTSKFPSSVPSSSPFWLPLPHLSSSSSPPVSHDSRSQSPCQICKIENHQALDCYNRMNYAFQGKHPPTELAAMVAEANTTYLNQHQWYADSGANIHVTFDAANLAIS